MVWLNILTNLIKSVNHVLLLATLASISMTVSLAISFMSMCLPLNDATIYVAILLSWLISVITPLVSLTMAAPTLVSKNQTTLVCLIPTQFQVSQSSDRSVLTISKSTSLSRRSIRNLSRTLCLGRTLWCLICTVCQARRQETSHKKNWWKLSSCTTSTTDLQQHRLYKVHHQWVKQSVKWVSLRVWQWSQFQSMLPDLKSVWLSVTNRTSENLTLNSWSTSLIWDRLSASPTSSQHLSLIKSSKCPLIVHNRWLVSSTLRTSTRQLAPSTKYRWWSVSCLLWLFWSVCSPKNSLVCRWRCCVSSLTFRSSFMKALSNCLSLHWSLWSTQQATTCNSPT